MSKIDGCPRCGGLFTKTLGPPDMFDVCQGCGELVGSPWEGKFGWNDRRDKTLLSCKQCGLGGLAAGLQKCPGCGSNGAFFLIAAASK